MNDQSSILGVIVGAKWIRLVTSFYRWCHICTWNNYWKVLPPTLDCEFVNLGSLRIFMLMMFHLFWRIHYYQGSHYFHYMMSNIYTQAYNFLQIYVFIYVKNLKNLKETDTLLKYCLTFPDTVVFLFFFLNHAFLFVEKYWKSYNNFISFLLLLLFLSSVIDKEHQRTFTCINQSEYDFNFYKIMKNKLFK